MGESLSETYQWKIPYSVHDLPQARKREHPCSLSIHFKKLSKSFQTNHGGFAGHSARNIFVNRRSPKFVKVKRIPRESPRNVKKKIESRNSMLCIYCDIFHSILLFNKQVFKIAVCGFSLPCAIFKYIYIYINTFLADKCQQSFVLRYGWLKKVNPSNVEKRN